MVLVNVAMLVMNDLLSCEKRHDKGDQGHGEDCISRREHPALHPDWWVALAHGQPNHTHAAREEQDSQHWCIVHSDRCLVQRFMDGPLLCVLTHEVSNYTDDRDCRVNQQILNGEVHDTLHSRRYRVLTLGP